MIALRFLARTINTRTGASNVRFAGDCYSLSTPVMKFKKKKKKDLEDTKCYDLRFDLHQTLEPADAQYTGILKNIPYECVVFSISVGFNFRCNVPRCRLGHFAIIFM